MCYNYNVKLSVNDFPLITSKKTIGSYITAYTKIYVETR